ncbi:hypothetical protein DVH24_013163 [Malus domestica]|uniref:HAT C-terminal dimerisation domain-containing protein n=1 Tax=Malus domestica TaxID=3750 RepID=A0A498IK29_MALDO|nr:hypothetical protein DVH24_013163 [Malus domestica]
MQLQNHLMQFEMDRYLLDIVEKVPDGSQFDVLKWWKLKGRSTYSTLALIAKDILPIQVSTVANESEASLAELEFYQECEEGVAIHLFI